jgi:hypothetical protein
MHPSRLLFAALAFGLATGPLMAEIVQRSFDVDPGGTLHIESKRGIIEVKTGGDRVEVTVKNADNLELEFAHDGNNVTITGDMQEGLLKRLMSIGWSSFEQPAFIITVPKRYNLDLSTGGGHIHIDDLEGEVKANTSGGHLRFGRIKGPVEGRTSGGHIDLISCQGRADVRTSGGYIKIDRVDGDVVARTSGGHISVNEVLGSIEARTSGGSVTATISRQPKTDCRLETSGGHVEVSLATNIAVDLDASTSGGKIRTDFPVTGELGRHLRSEINGGGPELFLRTSGGHISLRKI